MTKHPPERLRGKITATEWKRRGARGTIPPAPQAPYVSFEDLDILEFLLLLWATQETEEGLLRMINLLFSTIPPKPEYREKFLAVCNSFSNRFRAGSLLSNLVQTWNDRIPLEDRFSAAERVAREIGNPVSPPKWKQYRKHLRPLLIERHGPASDNKLLQKQTPIYLLNPSPGRARGEEAGPEGAAIIPFWLSFFFKSDKKGVEISLRVLLETALLIDFLGEKYRSKYNIDLPSSEYKSISLATQIKGSDNLTIGDTLKEERWSFYPDRVMYKKELESIINDIKKWAKLSERDMEIFWLISEGQTPRKIAVLMNTTANSIRVSINKARKKIQNTIGMDKLKVMTGND